MTHLAQRVRTVTDHDGHRRVALLSLTHLVDDFYQGAVPALLPLFALSRGYTGLAAGGLMFAATFVSSIVQPAFGVLSDRYRLRWLIVAGMLLAGAGIAVSGVTPSYALTWAVIAAAGIGVAAFHPGAARATREAAGGSVQAMAWFSVGGNVGIALAPVVVTPILAVTGLGGTPLLAVPAVLLGAAYGVLGVRHRRRGREAQAPVRRPAAAAGRNDWRRFGTLLVLVVMRSVAYIGVATFLVLYLRHRFGLSTGAAAPALTVFTGVGACGTVLGGWVADRWGRIRTVRLGYALTLVGLVSLVLAPSAVAAYLAVVVAGLGLYLPFAVHTILGQDYLPTRMATASGLTTGLAISAGGLLAPALGALADAQGRGTVLAVLIVTPLIALIASLGLRDVRQRAD